MERISNEYEPGIIGSESEKLCEQKMNAYKYYLIGLLKGAIKNLGAAINMPVKITL